jgi:RimJ/RimL family protein N-acetyltransferase
MSAPNKGIKHMISTLPNLGTLFTGKLVRLSAMQTEDYKLLTRWHNEAEYLRLLDDDPAMPLSLAAVTQQETGRRDRHEGRRFEFTFRTIADNTMIGFGGLGVDWNHRNAWIGIGIGEPAYRSKGYGTDGMRLLVGYAFRELDLHRVTLGVLSNNPRAIRCYEKVGFVREVIQRGEIYRDGIHFDSYTMGLLRSEWEAQQ